MRIILGAIFGLVTADGIISNYLISHGLAWELNPFLRDYVGSNEFMLLKAIAAFLCVMILWGLYHRSPGMVAISSIIICLFYTGVVYWNLTTVVVTL
jgi:hypothetical protein